MNDVTVIRPTDLMLAARAGAQVIYGLLLNSQGQTVGQYNVTLAFTTADDAGYLANGIKVSDTIIEPTIGALIGVHAITIPQSALSNILFNTAAQASPAIPITTNSPRMDDFAVVGGTSY